MKRIVSFAALAALIIGVAGCGNAEVKNCCCKQCDCKDCKCCQGCRGK